MTATDLNADLAQNRFGLRFLSRDTERIYRVWRNEQNLWIYRLVVLLSVPMWLLMPVAHTVLFPEGDWSAAYWLCYALVTPILVGMLAITYSPIRGGSTLLASIALTVTGCVGLYAFVGIVSPQMGFELTGPAIAFTIALICFALIMRLPPAMALISVVPFVIAAFVMVMDQAGTKVIRGYDAFGYGWVISTMCFIVAVMSVVNERFFRRAFVSEQTVTRQKASLEESRKLISRYVPPALASDIIEGKREGIDAPQRRRLTILFSDIVGFTDMADRVEPEVLTQIIGEYMAAMSEIVDAHNGTVNEFIGDGLMALFGAPQALNPEEQARGAIRAAQAMLVKLPELNAHWRKLGLGAALQIRIGINTGMTSVGSYGSEGRMTYTAIGLQTNIAARIQSHCQPGNILMSDATWQLIQDEIPCTPMGEVECKGVHFPVAVYSPQS